MKYLINGFKKAYDYFVYYKYTYNNYLHETEIKRRKVLASCFNINSVVAIDIILFTLTFFKFLLFYVVLTYIVFNYNIIGSIILTIVVIYSIFTNIYYVLKDQEDHISYNFKEPIVLYPALVINDIALSLISMFTIVIFSTKVLFSLLHDHFVAVSIVILLAIILFDFCLTNLKFKDNDNNSNKKDKIKW